ncbi:MAG: zinc dependent phospholipase C family protein [Spirochaetia bacterium]|nr:zinc dependent phospholipase C family protein [Spirochaetia bacterium]
MPSHITHSLFGREIAKSITITIKHHNWFTLGCQGPDIFLHNQRTMPSSLFWGKSLHRKNYGLFCSILIHEMLISDNNWNSPIGSYILGFLTHASLDRETHPFITYFSGWGKENKFYHPFLERLIDIKISSVLSVQSPDTYSFFKLINLGSEAPEDLINILSKAIKFLFKNSYSLEDINIRIHNAYKDSMYFLQKIDSWRINQVNRIKEIEKERTQSRLLALFHPPYIPDYLDVLNTKHSEWKHPWAPHISSKMSFNEIFKKTAQDVSEKINLILSNNLVDVVDLIGNDSLNSGLPYSAGTFPKVSSPIQLGKFLQELYC